MMRKIKLYIATSLNGKIADENGNVDWLESIPNPEKLDYGYDEFYKNIDTTIQGYTTYKQLIDWGINFPYQEKTNYVITNKQGIKDTNYVKFISKNHINFVTQLKHSVGGDIWVVGGGKINTMLLNAKLIDELQLFIMPIIISSGTNLFENLPFETQLELSETKSYSNGVVELKYRIK